MGGIVSQYYIQALGGIDRVQRFITLSTPHAGSWCVYLRSNIGCQQLRPNSSFLNQLNQQSEMLQKLNFTAIWSPFDLLTMSLGRARWVLDRSVRINVLRHKQIPSDSRIIQAVIEALLEPCQQNLVQVHDRSTLHLIQEQKNSGEQIGAFLKDVILAM